MLDISQQESKRGMEEAMQCIMKRELDIDP